VRKIGSRGVDSLFGIAQIAHFPRGRLGLYAPACPRPGRKRLLNFFSPAVICALAYRCGYSRGESSHEPLRRNAVLIHNGMAARGEA